MNTKKYRWNKLTFIKNMAILATGILISYLFNYILFETWIYEMSLGI